MHESRVEQYFDGRAATYESDANHFLWAPVRRVELRLVRRALGNVCDKEILELGCGTGFYVRQLLVDGAAHIWGVDLSAKMLARLPDQRVTPVCHDAQHVHLRKRFEIVLCAGVLEFVADPLALFNSAACHATNLTKFVLLFPQHGLFGRIYRAFHRRNGIEIRLFTRRDIERFAAESGWHPEKWFSCASSTILRMGRRS